MPTKPLKAIEDFNFKGVLESDEYDGGDESEDLGAYDLDKFNFDEDDLDEDDLEEDEYEEEDFDEDEHEDFTEADLPEDEANLPSLPDSEVATRKPEVKHDVPKPAKPSKKAKGKDHTMLSDHREMVDHLRNNLDLLLSCEIGQAKISLNNLLDFKAGEQLNLSTDLQQVKIKVNSTTIGYGQIVNIDGKYGIKITKVLSITESLKFS